MSRLTTRINGEWDFNSLEGERVRGFVCHKCGEIVPLVYEQKAWGMRYGIGLYHFCPNCFTGDTKTALTCRICGKEGSR